jgi:hypothetical protein
MHFLHTLVFSAVFCVSGALAATIRIDQSDCAGEKGIEIDFKIPDERPIPKGTNVGTSNQLVFPIINSTHIDVIFRIYAFSILTSLTHSACVGAACGVDAQCIIIGCSRCVAGAVSIARVLE